MKNKKSFNDSIARIIIIFLFIFVALSFIYFDYVYSSNVDNNKIINIDKNVMLKFNDEKEKKVNLSDYSFRQKNIGDSITISYNLPKGKLIKNPTLVINMYHSAVEVELDDDKIYEYGKSMYENNELIGHEYLFVPIPFDFQGKELKVKFTFAEKDSVTNIPALKIQNEGDSYTELANNNFIAIMVSMALILFGTIILTFSLTRRSFGKEYSNIAYISLFSICVAIWVACNSKAIFLFIRNSRMINAMEYFSLYAACIPVLLYFARIQSKEIYGNILNLYAGIYSAIFILTLLAYMIFGYHYSRLLPIYHILILLSLVLLLICTIIDYKNKSKSEKTLLLGISLVGFIIFVDIIRFNIDKYIVHNVVTNISIIPLGCLAFVLVMLYSYGVDLIQSMYGKKEREILERMAYKDLLTGIYNRNKCQDILKEYNKQTDINIIIVSFDINNLKPINDNLGHSVGDEMIIKVANLLTESFKEIGEVGRMGGDEFIIILKDKDLKNLHEALDDFHNKIDIFNENESKKFELSVSYGYAIREKDDETSLWKIYEKADKKMYDCKRRQKKSEQENRYNNRILEI